MPSTPAAGPRVALPWRRAGVLAMLAAMVDCDSSGLPAAARQDAALQIDRGRVLLAQYQCGSCHAIPGVADAQGRHATPLGGFGRRSYIAGRLPNDAAHLAAWIAEPRALVPTTTMPSMGVSADEAQAMAAYLRALE